MRDDFTSKAFPNVESATDVIRETLLRVCRHYQEPGLGAGYAAVAHYYETQVAAIPPPPEQNTSCKLRS